MLCFNSSVLIKQRFVDKYTLKFIDIAQLI